MKEVGGRSNDGQIRREKLVEPSIRTERLNAIKLPYLIIKAFNEFGPKQKVSV